MSLQTPTTAEISDNIIAQLESAFGQTVSLLPKSFLRVLSKALAAVFIILYKYGGFVSLQMFVETASINSTMINGVAVSPLIEWGRLIGVGDPVSATNAELIIDVTVETETGSLPSGSQLISSTNGVTYITVGAVLLDAPTVQATIKAVSDQAGGGGAGAIGNLAPGDIVSFANPLANVARDAVVDSQTVTGADAEPTEEYRQRVIDRFQKEPQGGAYADYETWGEAVAGIHAIYPYTGALPGHVDVYVEATVASFGDPDGIPTAAQLQAVADSIEKDENGMATRRPAGAFVNTLPITRTGFDTIVTGLAVDNAAVVQSDITEALTQFFFDADPFVDGLTIPPRMDRITRSALIGLVEDIVTAASGTFTTVNFSVTGVGLFLELHTLGEGEEAKLNSNSFVT